MVIIHELEAKTEENKRLSLTFNISGTFSYLRAGVPISERCLHNEIEKLFLCVIGLVYHDRSLNQLLISIDTAPG